MEYAFFDIHSHIHGEEFDSTREALLQSCVDNSVGTFTVGTDYVESERAVQCALQYENVFATVGIHPVDKIEDFDYDKLKNIAMNRKVVAVGECGLDYYWPAADNWKNGEVFEKNRQKALFENQINLAIELNLPLMIHGRPTKGSMDAYEDIIEVLKTCKREHGEKVRGNVHFFAGNVLIAKEFWGLGFTTSFTGVITFTHDYDEVIKNAPLEMLMAETDSPYATPVPHRGKVNTPLLVRCVYEKIAELKNIPLEGLQKQFDENRKRVFRA